MYKYAFYRVCKEATPVALVTNGNASTNSAAAAVRRHVTVDMRANQLDTEVVYQMMSMYRQQRRAGSGRGCWMSVDLRQNRIAHLLDDKAATALRQRGNYVQYCNDMAVLCERVSTTHLTLSTQYQRVTDRRTDRHLSSA